jgi:hypothetical protein
MRISGLSLDDFTAITASVSDDCYAGNLAVSPDAHDDGSRKSRCTARLVAGDSRGAGTRTSWSGRHGPYVCWHAYRDVLAEVFRQYPDAVVRTGLAGVYRGAAGFRRDYPATADKNIGSQMAPAYMPDLCECAS